MTVDLLLSCVRIECTQSKWGIFSLAHKEESKKKREKKKTFSGVCCLRDAQTR
jgi:hypothetical protein